MRAEHGAIHACGTEREGEIVSGFLTYGFSKQTCAALRVYVKAGTEDRQGRRESWLRKRRGRRGVQLLRNRWSGWPGLLRALLLVPCLQILLKSSTVMSLTSASAAKSAPGNPAIAGGQPGHQDQQQRKKKKHQKSKAKPKPIVKPAGGCGANSCSIALESIGSTFPLSKIYLC